MMKKNYSSKLPTFKNALLTTTIVGAVAAFMSFGPMFIGPGLTTPESFDLATDTSFPTGGTTADAYEVAFPNLQFDSPIAFVPVPGQQRIVIAELDGTIFWIDDNNNATVKNEIIELVDEVGDQTMGEVRDGGFLGLAIHPDFGTAGKNEMFMYYTTVSETGDNTLYTNAAFFCSVENFHSNYIHLEKFEVDPTTMLPIPNSRVLMYRRQMYNTTHRGGGMEFGDDGFLYITTGDQATYSSAQDIAGSMDGGVLRIDVDMDTTKSSAPIRTLASPGAGAGDGDEISGVGYFIPNDNPFNAQDVPSGSIFREYYSMGHRNPHRLTKDSATGTFYIGEVGQNRHEEINVLGAGNNYGWPLFEATEPFTIPVQSGTPCNVTMYQNMMPTMPLVEFQRSEANSITGGYVYRGSNIPDLVGDYICTDFGTGSEIWNVDTATGAKQLLGTFDPGEAISFGQDKQGELYFLKYGDNVNLYRLKSPLALNAAPALLSQTGVFSDLPSLTVSEGFIPYDMVDPFWSDGGIKTRFMAIPNDGSHDTDAERIAWSENGIWDFPVGSVLVKHFDYPTDEDDLSITRKIETRFSIKGTDGTFYFLTYKWLPDESDAELVDMTTGDNVDITVQTSGGGSKTVSWLYPSNSQCIACHNPALGGSLGPRTRFLNKDLDYSSKGGTVGNQLVTLSELGILDETITDANTLSYYTHAPIADDINFTLDERARSYLDNNCAYCHQPATGNNAAFDLRPLNSLAQTGLLTAVGRDIPGFDSRQRVLIPGDAANSQLFHRTNSKDPGIMMPPLAKGIIDTEGVALLQAWINGLQPLANPPALGTYRLVNVQSGQTLQVPSAGNAIMENVRQGAYVGDDYQHVVLEDAGNGYYQLRTGHTTDKYLDIEFASLDPDTNVWQYIANGGDVQQWQIIDTGDGSYNIISKLSGHYLGIQADGNIAVLTGDDSDAQRWEFRATGPSTNFGLVVEPGIVSTSEEGATDTFTVVLQGIPSADVVLTVIATLNDDEFSLSETQLTFTPVNWDTPQSVTVTGLDDVEVDGVQNFEITISVDDTLSDPDYAGFEEIVEGTNADNDGGAEAPPALGTYRLVNVGSGQTLQVPTGGIAQSQNVRHGPYTAANFQHVALEFSGGGYYELRMAHTTNQYLDIALASTDPDTNVWQYTSNGGDVQQWQIVDAGEGAFNIISKLSGHYLGIQADGNIAVLLADGSDAQKWQFREAQASVPFGIEVSPTVLSTSEEGGTDTFTVVLEGAPSSDVILNLSASENGDEFSLSQTQLTFTAANWDTPQQVTVTGLDDQDLDGVQFFEILVAVVSSGSDPDYFGFEVLVEGNNSDDDGGTIAPPPLGIYRLVNVESGETLQVPSAIDALMENVRQGAYSGADNEHVVLEFAGAGFYQLRTGHTTDKYLDIEFASTAPNTNVWQYIGNGGDVQQWEIVDAGNGSYNLISKLSGHYLGIQPDGNIAVLLPDGSNAQKWGFRPTGFEPEAVAGADVTSGNAPLAIQFTGNLSTDDKNDIQAYLWDFGNGATSTDIDPAYTYTQGGTYNVTLTITDGDGYTNESDSIVVTVNGAPEAVVGADIISGIAPLEVAFTGNQSIDDVGILSHAWDFDDGNNASVENPIHTFASAGTYTVELTVTDDAGLQDTASITIVVAANTAPVAVASADVMQGEAPLEVNFTGDQSTDDDVVVGYAWDFGDGTSSTLANPAHTFTVADTYTVVLTVRNFLRSKSSTYLCEFRNIRGCFNNYRCRWTY
ncbi:PKD domain-containing protein [Maribacter sp. 4U21]|uniref:PKD domain-containing protein n=1 Tax=Maribacter sp. 4U21 TaxID=1889779 RepID=UPI0015D4DA9B|nr:RICIN domain-containing protein [Maribacter sp. 4U21]